MTPEEERVFRGIQEGMTFGNSAADTSPYADEGPYGTALSRKKAGLTRRGKVAIVAAGAAIVVGGTVWYQAHSAAVAKDEKEAAALQVQMKRLELEEMKIRNEKQAADTQAASALAEKVQAAVDECVRDAAERVDNSDVGPVRSGIVADCRRQYDAAHGKDMEVAGSVRDTGSADGDGGVNPTALLGLAAAGATALVVFARKGQKDDT